MNVCCAGTWQQTRLRLPSRTLLLPIERLRKNRLVLKKRRPRSWPRENATLNATRNTRRPPAPRGNRPSSFLRREIEDTLAREQEIKDRHQGGNLQTQEPGDAPEPDTPVATVMEEDGDEDFDVRASIAAATRPGRRAVGIGAQVTSPSVLAGISAATRVRKVTNAVQTSFQKELEETKRRELELRASRASKGEGQTPAKSSRSPSFGGGGGGGNLHASTPDAGQGGARKKSAFQLEMEEMAARERELKEQRSPQPKHQVENPEVAKISPPQQETDTVSARESEVNEQRGADVEKPGDHSQTVEGGLDGFSGFPVEEVTAQPWRTSSLSRAAKNDEAVVVSDSVDTGLKSGMLSRLLAAENTARDVANAPPPPRVGESEEARRAREERHAAEIAEKERRERESAEERSHRQLQQEAAEKERDRQYKEKQAQLASEEPKIRFRPKVKSGGIASKWQELAKKSSPEKNLRTPGVRESQDLEDIDVKAIQAAEWTNKEINKLIGEIKARGYNNDDGRPRNHVWAALR